MTVVTPVPYVNRSSIIRLVGAVLAEQTDEWTEGRRYIGLELLTKARTITIETSQHHTDQADPTPIAAITSDRSRDGRRLHHQRGRDPPDAMWPTTSAPGAHWPFIAGTTAACNRSAASRHCEQS